MRDTVRSRRLVTGLAIVVVGVACVVLVAGLSGTTAGQTGPTVEIHDVSPDLVQVDEDVTVTYTANGTGITDDDVEIVLTHPHGNELRIGGETGTEVSQDITLDTDGLPPGPYNVTVEVDSGASVTATKAFELAPVYDPDDADFAPSTSSTDSVVANYEGVAGDFVEVSVTLTDVDEAYVIVGGDRANDEIEPRTPLDILHVSSSTTFLINTRYAGINDSKKAYISRGGAVTSYRHDLGADKKPQGVFEGLRFETEDYEQFAETLDKFAAKVGSGPQIRPLQPAAYSMVIGGGDSIIVTEEGFPDARYPLDRARFELERPRLGDVTTYRLPTGNADEVEFELDPSNIRKLTPSDIDALLGMAEETDTVVRGERILVEVEATGIYGALLDVVGAPPTAVASGLDRPIRPGEFGELLARPEGIDFTLRHTNTGPNQPATIAPLFDADAGDVTVLPEPAFGTGITEMDRFYVLVDTREPEPFDPSIRGGQEYEVEVRYRAGAYPYFADGEGDSVQTASMSVEEPFVEYDRTTSTGEPVVANSSDATLSGTTNLAPGVNLPVSIVIDVRNDPTKIEIENLDISPDGTFSVQESLDMLEAGAEVDIQFWAYQQLLDERQLVVVDEDEQTSRFEITEFTSNSIVTAQGTFAELTAVVTNTGLLADNRTVELLVDEEVVANQTVELGAGDSRAFHFEEVLSDLGPGEYAIEVRTPDDRDGELLIVEEADGVFEIDEVVANTSVDPDGPRLDFETTVVNAGNINETGTVELLIDGEQEASETRDLLTGQTVTHRFEESLAGLDPGTYNLTVRTPDDAATVEVTLEEPRSAFELVGVDARETVERGETLTVSALVNNTGNVAASGDVELALANETRDALVVELDPGENATVAFNGTVVDREPGEYNLTVRTSDDERTLQFVVEEAGNQSDGTTDQSDESSDQSDETGGPSEGPTEPADGDDGGPGGFLGLGIGRRAVVGGTAFVATIHVLGYWV